MTVAEKLAATIAELAPQFAGVDVPSWAVAAAWNAPAPALATTGPRPDVDPDDVWQILVRAGMSVAVQDAMTTGSPAAKAAAQYFVDAQTLKAIYTSDPETYAFAAQKVADMVAAGLITQAVADKLLALAPETVVQRSWAQVNATAIAAALRAVPGADAFIEQLAARGTVDATVVDVLRGAKWKG